MKPNFDMPVPTIGGTVDGDFIDSSGTYTGNGYAIAIIDTGVDKSHPAFTGRIIAEACFGENNTYSNADIESLCPGGATFSSAAGSGQDCTLDGCGHGTMVAGAAAAAVGSFDLDGDSVDEKVVGVAKDAKIIAIKVSAKVTSATVCAGSPGNVCAVPLISLYLAALDYVATTTFSYPVAAANLSIGDPASFYSTTSACAASPDAQAFSAAAISLRAHRIAPVVANGNSGDPTEYPSYVNKISVPACAEGAIAVGATNILGTAVASYSNNSPATTLLAPGGDYDDVNNESAIWLPENGTSGVVGADGTSFAAPMVAGAYAVLREKHPNANVLSLTTLLQNTGVDVTDARAGYTVGAKKRIDLDAALTQSPLPVIVDFTGPTGKVNEGAPIQLAAQVTGSSDCSLSNGIGLVTMVGEDISTSVPGAASYTLTCSNGLGDIDTATLNFTINTAPTVPAITQQVHSKATGTFLLEWSASSDSDGIQEYQVHLNGQHVASLPSTATSYTFENLLDNVAYTAEVRAVDTLGAISVAAVATFGAGSGVGAPNTGVLSLIQHFGMKSAVVAGLGVLAAVVIFTLARRRHTR